MEYIINTGAQSRADYFVADLDAVKLSTLKLLGEFAAERFLGTGTRPVVIFRTAYAESIGLNPYCLAPSTFRQRVESLLELRLWKVDGEGTRKVRMFEKTEFEQREDDRGSLRTAAVIQCTDDGAAFFDSEAGKEFSKDLVACQKARHVFTYRLYCALRPPDGEKRIVTYSIADLRKIMCCQNNYPNQRNFLARAVNPALNEITEATDIAVSAEKVLNENDRRVLGGYTFYVTPKRRISGSSASRRPISPCLEKYYARNRL